MAFINSPVKSIPAAAAFGGQALRQVEGSARSNQVMPSADITVSRTPSGTFLGLRDPSGGGGAKVVTMVVSVPSSYGYIDAVTCHLVGSTTNIEVLLPPKLRAGTRYFAGSEIRPAYALGDVIYCVELDKAGPTGELYLDLNVDARQFSIPVTHCQNEVTTQYWMAVTKYP